MDIGRPVGISHAAVIATLHGGCFASEMEPSWDEKAVAELLSMPGAFAHVASRQEDPAGFVLARVAADEAEIISIGVLPDIRRRGVAKALLKDAINTAAQGGAARMFLEVAEDNTAALAFYQGEGFSACGRRAGYYKRSQGTVDAQILVLDIAAHQDNAK